MRIVALVESEDHVCCRYRLAAFRDSLRRGRSSSRHSPAAPHHLRTSRNRPRSGDCRRCDRPTETSASLDSIATPSPRAPAHLRLRRRGLASRFVLAARVRRCQARAAIPSNRRGLRSRRRGKRLPRGTAAGNHTSPDRVVVIPTCVEPAKYAIKSNHAKITLQLVWVGSQSTLRGLEQFTEVLARSAARCRERGSSSSATDS